MGLSPSYEVINQAALAPPVSDEEVIERVRAGDTRWYEILTRRYRRRFQGVVYRILRNDAEVEDTIQEAHFHALKHLSQFAGRSSFCTWLTRIVVHEACSRARVRRRFQQLDPALLTEECCGFPLASRFPDPERQMMDEEMRAILEYALGMLPERYRTVFLKREIDQMSTADTARVLGISGACVRIRLHRARSLLRKRITERLTLNESQD
jgi:RNA polymerase sigma-70 factor, ECF subfamily